jgi:alkylation response protein AidB-like acyl-CoA dehydrogenase
LAIFSEEQSTVLAEFYPASPEYAELLSGLASYIEENVLPDSGKLDAGSGQLPRIRAGLLAHGLCQIQFPREFGGLGLPFGVYVSAVELVGSADAGVALSVAIHNTAAEGLFAYGSPALKERYLADIISGKRVAAFALTEPTSGSDAKAIGTKAQRRGDEYVLDGSKMFITNAGEADVYFVFAATEKGPSGFMVEKGDPGIEAGDDIPKLGMRGSRTAEVRFTDCKIPADRLVGAEGRGFEYAKSMLNASRIVMGSLCVGIANTAFSEALAYAKQRRAFGGPISDFQLTREKIADMKTGITAGRLMCMHAARLREMGRDFASEASQAKVFASEMSLRVTDAAIQIFGGYGYTSPDVHRHWRDARLLTIGEGTSEVLRLLIAGKELSKAR